MSNWPLLTEIELGGLSIDPQNSPRSLQLHADEGILAANPMQVQTVHRREPPHDESYEVRSILTPGGDYLVGVCAGGHYGQRDPAIKINDIIGYRSKDKGKTWQGGEPLWNTPNNQHGFVALISKRFLQRIYAFGTEPAADDFSPPENGGIAFRFSDDDGHTWSEPTRILPRNAPDYRGMSVMRMTETDAGTWLLGTHCEIGRDWEQNDQALRTRQFVLRSEDAGESWELLPDAPLNGWECPGFNRMDEGRPIALGGGNVLLMARTPEGHLWELRSQDDGKTWSEPRSTTLVHPDAPPMLFHLSDGKTLVAFHHNRHGNKAHFDFNARSELWASLSRDDGHTWSAPRFVVANAVASDDPWLSGVSYCDLLVDKGQLHLFVPHRWRQVLQLSFHERDLENWPTRADLQGESGK